MSLLRAFAFTLYDYYSSFVSFWPIKTIRDLAGGPLCKWSDNGGLLLLLLPPVRCCYRCKGDSLLASLVEKFTRSVREEETNLTRRHFTDYLNSVSVSEWLHAWTQRAALHVCVCVWRHTQTGVFRPQHIEGSQGPRRSVRRPKVLESFWLSY